MFTVEFWKATAERAIRTFAQTMSGVLLAAGISSVWGVEWGPILGAAVLAALFSLLTSLGAGWKTGTGPSLTSAEVVEPKAIAPPG